MYVSLSLTQVGGFAEDKNSTSVQCFSSITKPVPSWLLMVTAAAEDVNMTRLTVFAFAQAFKTFSTPWIAGFIMSFYKQNLQTAVLMKNPPVHFPNQKHILYYLWIFRSKINWRCDMEYNIRTSNRDIKASFIS